MRVAFRSETSVAHWRPIIARHFVSRSADFIILNSKHFLIAFVCVAGRGAVRRSVKCDPKKIIFL